MNRTHLTAGYCLALTLLAGTAPRLLAQAAPVPPATAPVGSDEDAIVELSPFVVDAEEDKGYRATSTLAGTRIKTDLRDVGSAISVITQQFLQDTASKNNQDLLVYTTSTEVSGNSGNYAGVGYGAGVDDSGSLLRPNSNTRVRGLDAADNTRDFFITEIPWDSYNVGRVDLQRGPNSILFGLGSPAGIINATTNIASFKDANKIEMRLSQHGSVRGSVDFNKVLLKNELALRIDALYDKTHYRQEPTYQKDKRLFGALKYTPKFLAINGMRTEVRVNAETGNIKANRPHLLPPNDRISAWFDPAKLNKMTADYEGAWNEIKPFLAANGDGTYTDTGVVNPLFAQYPAYRGYAQSGSPYYQPWLGSFGNALGGPFVVFDTVDALVQNPTALVAERYTTYAINKSGSRDGGIEAFGFGRPLGVQSFGSYAFATKQPGYKTGDYKDVSITDRSLFDYVNQSIDGPNKKEWSNWESFNAALAQTFFNQRAGFELTVDHQQYDDGQLIWANQGIGIDLNKTRSDGSLNPNLGRAYVTGDPGYGNVSNNIQRDSLRGTAFGEFRFSDILEKSTLTQVLGRHVFTGLVGRDEREVERREWVRYAFDQGFATLAGKPSVTDNARQPNTVVYLSSDLSGRTSASGLNLRAPQQINLPMDAQVRYFDSNYNHGGKRADGTAVPNPGDPWTGNWKVGATSQYAFQSENPANYVGWKTTTARVLSVDSGEGDQLMKSGYKQKDRVDSKAFVWQGFLFDGIIVPTVGVRKDTAKTWLTQASDYKDTTFNTVDPKNPRYTLEGKKANVVKGRNTSWSVVVHTPKQLRAKLPFNTGISLYYNKSSNFKADASRVDVVGNPIGAPSGDTKDYGIVISTFDDKVSLKVNKFETSVKNATVNVDDAYKLGAVEAWGRSFAGTYRDNWGQSWQWNWDSGNWWDGLGEVGPNGAESAVRSAAKAKSVKAWFDNYAGDAFYKAWAINTDPIAYRNGTLGSSAPAGFSATGDTESKGYEFELIANPIRSLSLSVNASKVTATKNNVGGALAAWVEKRTPVYFGEAGDIRLWWAGSNYRVRDVWTEFYSKYTLLKNLEGQNSPELRPWRFNGVANYNFTSGVLEGFNVGGGYRWQDKVVIGYKLAAPAAGQTAKDVANYDINKPIHGQTEDAIDLWFGYEKKLTFLKGIKWRIQLNLRNVGDKARLVPIAIQPTGEIAHYKIMDGMGWTLSNSFEF